MPEITDHTTHIDTQHKCAGLNSAMRKKTTSMNETVALVTYFVTKRKRFFRWEEKIDNIQT